MSGAKNLSVFTSGALSIVALMAVAEWASDLKHMNDATTLKVKVTDHSKKVFQGLPSDDTRHDLNSAWNNKDWANKLSSITHNLINAELLKNNSREAQLLSDLDIAILPYKQAQQPTSLVINNKGGCLLVDFEKSAQQVTQEALPLLKAHSVLQAANDYRSEKEVVGTYTLTTGDKVRFGGSNRSVDCPRP